MDCLVLTASLSIIPVIPGGVMSLYKHTLSLKVCLEKDTHNRLVHNNVIFLAVIILLKDCFIFQDQC